MFKNLDWAQSLLSIKSSSLFAVGHSTNPSQTDYQDACGALASVKQQCGGDVSLVASYYCYCYGYYLHGSRVRVQDMVRQNLTTLLKSDKKNTKNVNKLTDIVLGRVFHGKFRSQATCGGYLGISRQAYTKTWQGYVEFMEGDLLGMLSLADITVGNYRCQQQY